jgi:hypothetical protein
MRAHRRGARGRPGAAPRRKPLEHLALDHHLLAAQFEEVDLIVAQLLEPFFQRRQRIACRQQRIKPRQRPICRIARAGEALGRTFGGEREVSAAKVYGNRIYALNINVLS